MRGLRLAVLAAAAGGVGSRLLATGQLTLDTGVGRVVRPLGPVSTTMAAPRDVVFDVIAAPYLERTPRAMADEIEVLERGSDMVLAAHRTPVRSGLVTTTLETVTFHRPDRIDFRLVRGPVPYVVESFVLHEGVEAATVEAADGEAVDGGGPGRPSTRLDYSGELGTDLWALGRWWGDQVAGKWETTVQMSLERIRAEAERRARTRL